MQTCPDGGDWATKQFSGSTVAAIRSGALKHHFDIDMWFTKAPASLKITNLKMKGGSSFANECKVAYTTWF